MRLVGLQWQVPSAHLFTQLGLMAASALLALGIFLSANGGGGQKLQQWLRRPGTSAGLALATICVCVAAVVVSVLLSADGVKPAVGKKAPVAKFADSPVVSQRTQRYSFSYYSQQAAQAQALLDEADRVYARVAALLGSSDGPRIDVDLTGSLQNTEGTAFHDRIRMHLGRNPVKVLAHETAHVLAHRMAGGELDREFSKMSVLNEGLATWVHNHVAGDGTLREIDRFQAAVVSRRRLLTPAQLTDIDTLAQHADINLRYPLGAALVESLVARHGPDAPRKLLLALADPDFPRDLSGSELWYAAFQAAGFDLGQTFDDYARRLQGWETEFAARIAALPRPRVSLGYRKGQVGIDVRWEGQIPSGWGAVVRTRPRPDSPMDQYMQIRLGSQLDSGSLIWISRSRAVNDQLCFQSGLQAEEAAIFEAWSCVPLEPDP
jgi:hypothetical protein